MPNEHYATAFFCVGWSYSVSRRLLVTAAPSCRAQEVESIYGPLPVFEFHSGFWVNLHHFLYHEARARLAAKDARDAAAKRSTSGTEADAGLRSLALRPRNRKPGMTPSPTTSRTMPAKTC